MATYVLLHGGWGGGWEWRRVADMMSADGHVVYRPSLTGLGDRRHLVTRTTGLDTHIQDVVNLFESEELADVILCGHSYSGMVVSGAVEHVADKIDEVVFIDGFAPEDGEALLDLVPVSLARHMRELAASEGDGWLIPMPFPIPQPGEAPPDVVAYFTKASVPMPLACFDTPVRMTGTLSSIPSRYIRCTQIDGEDALGPSAQRAAERGWDVTEIDAPHDVQFFAPERLAEILLR